jgi:hypothetical protein
MNIANEFDVLQKRVNSLTEASEKIRCMITETRDAFKPLFDPIIQKIHELGDYVDDEGYECIRFLTFVAYRKPESIIIDTERFRVGCNAESTELQRTYNIGQCEYSGVTIIRVGQYDKYDYHDDDYSTCGIWLPKSWFESDDWVHEYKELFDKEMEPILAQEKAVLKEAEERERMQYEKLKAKFEQTGE